MDPRAEKNLEGESKVYTAPALEKGLDILEMLCKTEAPMSQKEIAKRLDRSVGEIYRMLNCLVSRNYLAQIDENYTLTTKLFEMAHQSPPTHRLLHEARPIMQRLSSELDQSCHLTIYGQGKQVVIAKVDVPSGMGFSVRIGAELDVIVSVSGRVLLAFQDNEVTELRIREALDRQPDHYDGQLSSRLNYIRGKGFESAFSVQVRGLYAVSYPILDSQNHAIAALTVPYAERIDQVQRPSIIEVETTLGKAAALLSSKIGGNPRI